MPRRGGSLSSVSRRRRLIHDALGPQRNAGEVWPSEARWSSAWRMRVTTSGHRLAGCWAALG